MVQTIIVLCNGLCGPAATPILHYYIVCLWKWNNSYAMHKTDAKTNLCSPCVFCIYTTFYSMYHKYWDWDASNLWACCVFLRANPNVMLMFWYFPLNFYEFFGCTIANACLSVCVRMSSSITINGRLNWSGQIERRIHTQTHDKRNQWTHACMCCAILFDI